LQFNEGLGQCVELFGDVVGASGFGGGERGRGGGFGLFELGAQLGEGLAGPEQGSVVDACGPE
jgi:hypothetical protein